MEKYPDIYIVHFSELKERKEKIIKDLSEWPEKIEFVEEFHRDKISEELKKEYYLKDDKKIKELTGFLSNAEIACAISHLEIYKKIIAKNQEYALVLEDDAIPEKNFIEQFKENLKNTPENWDIIYMGQGCGDDFIKEKLKTAKKINNFCYEINSSNCAEAYLIKKTTAKKLIQNMIPFSLPIDWEMAYQLVKMNAKILWWVPYLFVQGSNSKIYKSSIR